MPAPAPAGALAFFSLISVIAQSVVSSRPLTLAAFWRAIRSTFVGTITPAFTRSPYWPVAALKPNETSFDSSTFWATIEVHYDLQSGRYIAGLLDNEEKMYDFGFQTTPDEFSPQSLRKRGIR